MLLDDALFPGVEDDGDLSFEEDQIFEGMHETVTEEQQEEDEVDQTIDRYTRLL